MLTAVPDRELRLRILTTGGTLLQRAAALKPPPAPAPAPTRASAASAVDAGSAVAGGAVGAAPPRAVGPGEQVQTQRTDGTAIVAAAVRAAATVPAAAWRDYVTPLIRSADDPAAGGGGAAGAAGDGSASDAVATDAATTAAARASPRRPPPQQLPPRVEWSVQRVAGRSGAWLTLRALMALRDAAARAGDDGADGVVVITGTDALEEVATALDLLLPCEEGSVPVVVVGASRPQHIPGYDGVSNVATAIAVITAMWLHRRCADNRGAQVERRSYPGVCDVGRVLVAAADAVHAARYVTKRDSTLLAGMFSSAPAGVLADVRRGVPHWYCTRLPALRRYPALTLADVDDVRVGVWAMGVAAPPPSAAALEQLDGTSAAARRRPLCARVLTLHGALQASCCWEWARVACPMPPRTSLRVGSRRNLRNVPTRSRCGARPSWSRAAAWAAMRTTGTTAAALTNTSAAASACAAHSRTSRAARAAARASGCCCTLPTSGDGDAWKSSRARAPSRPPRPAAACECATMVACERRSPFSVATRACPPPASTTTLYLDRLDAYVSSTLPPTAKVM